MTRETQVPALPAVGTDNLQQVVQAIKNGLDVREGRLGDPLDQFVTLRELKALGLVTDSGDTSMTGVGGAGKIPVIGGNGAFGPDGYDETSDLSSPPAPQGLAVTGGYSAIYLSWYGNNYRNHAYTEIWRNTVDELGSAVKIGSTIGNLYSDEVGTEKTYFYWVRFVSQANVVGPYNLTSGTSASTALDVVKRLDILREDILNDSLVQDLGQRLTITETGITRLDSVTASQAQSIQQVSSVVGSFQSAVQVLAKAVDGVSAQYTVKIDNNGHVSGFGLASKIVNGTPRSAFIVRADRFAIVGANDASDPLGTLNPTNVPFVVLTSPQTIDGLSYPAGVWIKTAFVADATITNAKIASLAASKITAGTITAAVDMQSPIVRSGNISPGTSGFYLGQFSGVNRFYIGNGSTGTTGRSLEFDGSNAVVRGSIFAYAGTIGGILIDATGISSSNYITGSTGFSINTSGAAEFNNVSMRGLTVYNSSGQVILSSGSGIPSTAVTGLGTLATQNTVSTGQVTGLGTLATQNNVNWNTQIVNIPAFGNFAYLSQITSANISTYIAGAAIGTAYISNAAITNALIADAAISTAKIGTAQVSTLLLQNESVTVNRSLGYFFSTPTYYWTEKEYVFSYLDITVPDLGLDASNNPIKQKLALTALLNVYPVPGYSTSPAVSVVLRTSVINNSLINTYPVWNSSTTYAFGATVRYTVDGGVTKVFTSKISSNLNNPPYDRTYWNDAGTLSEAGVSLDTAGVFTGTIGYIELTQGSYRLCVGAFIDPDTGGSTRQGIDMALNAILQSAKR